MSQAPQRSQQWHEARKSKITGSVSGAILSLNPYMAPEAVMRRLVRDFHGQESEFTGNIATEYGQNHEPLALLGYINKTGNAVDEVGFCSPSVSTGLAQALTASSITRLF